MAADRRPHPSLHNSDAEFEFSIQFSIYLAHILTSSAAARPTAPLPVLDVSTSLPSSARRLVQARLGLSMTQAEIQALDAGLVEALGVLRAGTNEEHRAALRLVALNELSTQTGTQLWACLLAESGCGMETVAGFVAAPSAAASAVARTQFASARFASALGLQWPSLLEGRHEEKSVFTRKGTSVGGPRATKRTHALRWLWGRVAVRLCGRTAIQLRGRAVAWP